MLCWHICSPSYSNFPVGQYDGTLKCSSKFLGFTHLAKTCHFTQIIKAAVVSSSQCSFQFSKLLEIKIGNRLQSIPEQTLLPSSNQGLFLSSRLRSPCEHFLCFWLLGNWWLLVRWWGIDMIFSRNVSTSPKASILSQKFFVSFESQGTVLSQIRTNTRHFLGHMKSF